MVEPRREENPLLAFDPQEALVGKVSLDRLALRDGWNELAQHEESGARLWGLVRNGASTCYRFTDRDGVELETLHISPTPDRGSPDVDPEGLDPTRDPAAPPESDCFGQPVDPKDPDLVSGADGGTPAPAPSPPSCPYVCAPLGDGGQICWEVCSGD